MEADGAGGKEPIEGGREQVLAGVLLHVIETPRPQQSRRAPTDPARLPAGICRHDVNHAAVVGIDDVDDLQDGVAGTVSVPVSKGCPPDVG